MIRSLPLFDGSKMILSEDFEILEVAGEYMAIPLGNESDRFRGVVALNEEAAFLLENMRCQRNMGDLVDLLFGDHILRLSRNELL